MYKRIISLDPSLDNSFFLWGPRQTGKSHLLRERFSTALYINLLDSEEFVRLQMRPALLRERIKAKVSKGGWVIIDEIQKVPLLLDEVHLLIESEGIRFGLCGSSARKVRRGHANLLGGRAYRFEMFGLVSAEMEKEFNLVTLLNSGCLPRHYSMANEGKSVYRALNAYTSDYLKEEIAAEGLVRNLPQFSRFLEMAVLSDTEQLSFATIARDCGVSPPTVKSYFEILEDTLMARFLPAYQKRPKRRIVTTPKVYFSDVGVVNFLAKRGKVEPGSELFGKAFENWVHHEIQAYRSYSEKYFDLSFWRLSTGVEVDFILGNMEVAVEVKASRKIHSDHLKGVRELIEDYPDVKRRIVVSLEKKARRTDDDIEILPYSDFSRALWKGQIL